MKVLMLLSYPIAKPQHGGQLRCAAERRALSEAGVDVTSLAVFDASHYPDFEAGDIAVSHGEFLRYENEWPWNVNMGKVVLGNAALYGSFERTVLGSAPDAYLLVQPWLWPVLKAVLSRHPEAKRPIVYSSQNIEWTLLRDMLDDQGACDAVSRDLVAQAREIEREVTASAALCVACTKADEEELRRTFGACATACFPNGIDPIPEMTSAGRDWVRTWSAGRRWAAFVGSSHPPNAEGFRRLCGDNLGYLPPDCGIAILGGVGDLLHGWANDNIFSALNASRSIRTGRIESDWLNAAILSSRVILLPILTGGGSNLKTAEALVSGKPILATDLAFRGYDALRDLPTVNVINDPAAWKRRLRELLEADDLPRLSEEQRRRTERCLWKNILADYPTVVRRTVTG